MTNGSLQDSRWVDPVFRTSAAVVTAWFVGRAMKAFLETPQNIILVLLVISEMISLITIILSRRPTIRDIHPAYMVLTVCASFVVPLFISVRDNIELIPQWIGALASGIGLVWIIYAKLSLGRSFGLLAAKRVIKVKGAYSFVRHPIYAGYFIVHVAFLLTSYDHVNLVVIVSLYCMQVLRALREESVLLKDDLYAAYCREVPYRFIYGVF
ncbi:MAG TPA: isoprenylcysteine carboxylmethyltransferase family protein [Terriglobia bacterium]|nr:isoprenylcysteine carboxylmethyltransferase family protein [Terriglobia bacterium]